MKTFKDSYHKIFLENIIVKAHTCFFFATLIFQKNKDANALF